MMVPEVFLPCLLSQKHVNRMLDLCAQIFSVGVTYVISLALIEQYVVAICRQRYRAQC